MKDLLVVGALILSFALMFTSHVATVYGLAQRPPRWRAAIAFFVPPLGWYWAWREKMRVRLWVSLGALGLYVVALIASKI